MASWTWSVSLRMTHWENAIRHWYPHHAVVCSLLRLNLCPILREKKKRDGIYSFIISSFENVSYNSDNKTKEGLVETGL